MKVLFYVKIILKNKVKFTLQSLNLQRKTLINFLNKYFDFESLSYCNYLLDKKSENLLNEMVAKNPKLIKI